ncbi:unnamed protein product, partial [Strongylus vulgaris]
MPSPSQHDSKESRQTPQAQCDPNQPSTSYHVPGQSSYLNAPVDNPSFLVPPVYTGISYEVDDSTPMLEYSYDSHVSMSKYLEDVDSNSAGMLDVPMETLNIHASSSVQPGFSYLTEPLSNKSNTVPTSSISPDEAQFSPPDCVSIMPLSAPLSSESQYIPSPSDHSESLVAEARLAVGQPAAKATLKDVQEVRYESPKNHDESWIMRAFYSSSEEFNSPDDWETRKSAEVEEDVQLEANESEGGDSLVDKLFEMLERAEESGDEQGEDKDDEHDVTITKDPQSTPQPSPSRSPKQLLIQHQRISPITAVSRYPSHQPMEFALDSFDARAGYRPPQVSYAASTEFAPPYNNEQGQSVEQP